MTSTVKRLFKRSTGIYYFRLSTPSEKWLSLRTRDPVKAMMIAARLNAEIEMSQWKQPNVKDVLNSMSNGRISEYKIDIRQGTIEVDGPEDHALAMQALPLMLQAREPFTALSAPTPQESLQPKLEAKTFSQSLEAYIQDCIAVGNKERTIYAKRSHLETFGHWFGLDRSLDEINKRVLDEFINHLRHTPPERTKGGAGKKDADGRSAKTIDNYFHTLRPFLAFCISRGHCNLEANPAGTIQILTKSDQEKTADQFDLFTDDELSKIFDPESFKSFMNMPDFFWIPLIGYFTGMRISEIGSLEVKDFVKMKGIDYINVRTSKTRAGIRPVPIHPTLMELGLLTYVEDVKSAKQESLFPFRNCDSGRRHKRTQERFAEYRAKLGIAEGMKGIHSFRVGMITRLVEKHAQSVHIKRITGHSVDTSAGQAVHERYVRKVKTLHETIALFDSEDFAIDVQALRYKKGDFSSFLSPAIQ